MTDAAVTGRTPFARRAWPSRRAGWSAAAAPAFALAGLALFAHPYLGLQHDSRVYVGRMLADLDPAGVGRDLMYASDGQSGFSGFPPLLTALGRAVGPSIAAASTALAGLAAWCAAAALMLGALAGPRRRGVLLAAALILPGVYGGVSIAFGEAMAVPRPFAEALVLVGLWALLRERPAMAAGCMLAATAVHPIMALPGWGVLFAVLAGKDRRWLLAAAGGAAVVVAGAALRLPVLGRLIEPVDPSWLRILAWRNTYLFPTRWPLAEWGRLAVQGATVALAAVSLAGRARTLLWAVLGCAAAALFASIAIGDGAHSLLVLQLQPWRALWLVSFLAAATWPLAASSLWRGGSAGRLGAGALLLAWTSLNLASIAFAALALLALCVLAVRRRRPVEPRVARVALGALLATSGVLVLVQGWAILRSWALAPAMVAPMAHSLALTPEFRVAALALGLAASAWLSGRVRRLAPLAPAPTLAAALACFVAGAVCWDARSPLRRNLEDAAGGRHVRAVLAARPGQVLWLGGDLEAPLLAGRPAWESELQGASIVFSRPQALEWDRRVRELVADGMGPPELLSPYYSPPDQPARSAWAPAPGALDRFCARPGAPAWVVVPLPAGASPGLGRAVAGLWTPPLPTPTAGLPDTPPFMVNRYALAACGAGRSA